MYYKKHINIFYKKKYKECQGCNSKKSLKRHYEKKVNITNQRKLYYQKNRDKLTQKQNDGYTHFEGLVISFVELENRLKTSEEKVDSENYQNYCILLKIE